MKKIYVLRKIIYINHTSIMYSITSGYKKLTGNDNIYLYLKIPLISCQVFTRGSVSVCFGYHDQKCHIIDTVTVY